MKSGKTIEYRDFNVWQNQDMSVEASQDRVPNARSYWAVVVNAPDSTTAAHNAALQLFPMEVARSILLNYLDALDWGLSPAEAEQVEEFDAFLCSLPGGADSLFPADSVFQGLVKYQYQSWIFWADEENVPEDAIRLSSSICDRQRCQEIEKPITLTINGEQP